MRTAQKPNKSKKMEFYDQETDQNPEEMEFTEDELCSSLCRDDFYSFCKEFWSTIIDEEPVWNWHIKVLCDEFQKIAERVFAGLPLEADTTVNISPGTTKTTCLCVMLPAWIWTRMPNARIANISYAHDIAMAASLLSRDIITSEKYRRLFPEIVLREDTNAKAHYANTLKGYRYACGIDGQILGKHFHFIFVDDPLDPEQAASEAELKRVNRFMERTLPSRKVNKKVTPIVLIMQRLAENDPTGIRLERAEAGMAHNHFCLPAELTEDVKPERLREYYVDGLMDPVRLDGTVLERVQKEQGDFVLASQYLQRPIPEGMAMFHVDKITLYDAVPADVVLTQTVRSWDKASSTNQGAYTVGFKGGIDDKGSIWILHVERERFDSGRRERLIKNVAVRDGRSTVIAVEQEPGSGGKHSAQVTSSNLLGFRVIVNPVGKSDGDKIARAYGFSTQVNNGNVNMVRGDWNRALINEMRYFPASKYKDQVDAGSQCVNVLSNKLRILGGRKILPSRTR